MRRPELFSLRLYRPTGIRSQVVRTYCQVINTSLELVEGVRNQTILSVVIPLTQFFSNLPEYARTTRSIHPNTLRLRNAIAHMQDPQKLLFTDVPKALGFYPVEPGEEPQREISDAAELRERLWEALMELRDAYTKFVKKVRGRFVLAMADLEGQEMSFGTLRHDVRKRAADLVNVCVDAELTAVLRTLAVEKGTDDDWLSQVAAIIMKKPVASWRDGDLEPFAIRVGEIREHMHQLRSLKRTAERNLDDTDQSFFFGVSIPGRGLFHKNLAFSKPIKGNAKRVLREFKQADKETRTALLSLLIKTMTDKGDFH